MGGLYIVFESQNLIKRLVGLSIFQTSVIVLYVTLGKVAGGTAPIFMDTGHHGDDHGDHTDHADATHEAGKAAVHDVSEYASEDSAHASDAHHSANTDHANDAAHQVKESAHHGAEYAASGHDVAGHGADASHAVVADVIYSNPLPHVLMLTAIVVGVATLSVGLALVVRIREAYGTIEMDDVNAADMAACETEGEKA